MNTVSVGEWADVKNALAAHDLAADHPIDRAAIDELLGALGIVAAIVLCLNKSAQVRAAAVAGIVACIMLTGGSMNSLGNWLLDTFPALTKFEESFTPKSLQGEIMKKTAQP